MSWSAILGLSALGVMLVGLLVLARTEMTWILPVTLSSTLALLMLSFLRFLGELYDKEGK